MSYVRVAGSDGSRRLVAGVGDAQSVSPPKTMAMAGNRSEQRRGSVHRFIQAGDAAAFDEITDRRRQEPHAHHQSANAGGASLVMALRPTGLRTTRRSCAGIVRGQPQTDWRVTSARAAGHQHREAEARRTGGRGRTCAGSTALSCAASLHPEPRRSLARTIEEHRLHELEPARGKIEAQESGVTLLSRAKRLSVDPACSNGAQNSAAARKRTTIAMEPRALPRDPALPERSANEEAKHGRDQHHAGSVRNLRRGDRHRTVWAPIPITAASAVNSPPQTRTRRSARPLLRASPRRLHAGIPERLLPSSVLIGQAACRRRQPRTRSASNDLLAEVAADRAAR